MASFEVRRLPKVPALALMLVAAPSTAFSQLDSLQHADEVLVSLAETIEETREQNGVHSPELIGPTKALALYYEEHEDHALAIAAIEQVRQLIRVNYGLYSLEEAPLLQQWIHAERARGNDAGAWDVEQRLLKLVRRNANDLRTVPILRELAQRRLDILARYIRGEFPPEIVLGCYYSAPEAGDCRAGSRGRVKDALLREAISYYSQAINTILRTEGLTNDELPDLLMEVARISYEHGRPSIGRKSLRFLLSYSVENRAPRSMQTDALLQIADWDLLFAPDHTIAKSAIALYEHAYAELARVGTERRAIERLFSPDVPVVLPAFLPNPLVSKETRESTGFIDVEFDITRGGESEDIEVLDTTTGASDAAKERLVDLIDDSRFRPIVTNGHVEDAARVALRYYLRD